MKGPTRVEFVPIKHGDLIEQTGDEAIHFVGFKPGPAGKREGWLVYLVHTSPAISRKTTWPYHGYETVKVPKGTGVHKRRRT